MKLSVIILNYNVRYFLEQCILTVKGALVGIDSEIIVVDNNSSDDSCAMVRSQFPDLKLIANTENLGFSKANNQAVKEARGAYVCILNPDTAIPQELFRQTLDFACKHEKLGALGVRLIDGTGQFLPESKRNLPTPRRSLLKLLGFTGGKNSYYAKHLSPTETGRVDVLPGAFMLLKRSVYEEVDGFDEDYFMYGEDIDLSYKLQQAGYDNYYLGELKMLHYKGESTVKDRAYLDRFYGAMRLFYAKHFSSNKLLRGMVNMAVVVAKVLRGRGTKRQNTQREDWEEVLLFTEQMPLLKFFSETYGPEASSRSKSRMGELAPREALCIFDADYVSYAQILDAMDEWKKQGNNFRIKPAGCSFVLGSDSSDEKGVVLPLKLTNS